MEKQQSKSLKISKPLHRALRLKSVELDINLQVLTEILLLEGLSMDAKKLRKTIASIEKLHDIS